MTCEQCEWMLAELDGGTAPPELAGHLERCADCRSLAGVLEANTVAMVAMREEAVPAPPEAVKTAIQPVAVMPAPAPMRALAWAAVAAAVFLAGVGIWTGQGDREQSPDVEQASVEPEQSGPDKATASRSTPDSLFAAGRADGKGASDAKDDVEDNAANGPRAPVMTRKPESGASRELQAAIAVPGPDLPGVDKPDAATARETVPATRAFPAFAQVPYDFGEVLEPAGEIPPAEQQTVVKVLTPDPEVVIYWLVNEDEGGAL